MATPNLNLEAIELTDNMKTSLLEKMNNNFKKIDDSYKILTDLLIENTGTNNLAEAIAHVEDTFSQLKRCYVSTSQPSDAEGKDGDLWLILEGEE